MLYVDCFGEALRRTQEGLNRKNYYAFNPEYRTNKGARK